jgi:hypothetical protein
MTPYVGRSPGLCRYGTRATGTTTSFKRGAGKGAMTFSGLAPFSPR